MQLINPTIILVAYNFTLCFGLMFQVKIDVNKGLKTS